jgi:hypothetical protein
MKPFKEYRLEFGAGILAALGFLLLSQHGMVEGMLAQAYFRLTHSLQAAWQWLQADLPRLLLDQPVSTLIGWLLVLLATPFVIYRVRYRFRLSERWEPTVCPKCSARLHRIHRTRLDRLLSHTLLPGARRYECANPACSWNGLRRNRHPDRAHGALSEAADIQNYPP